MRTLLASILLIPYLVSFSLNTTETFDSSGTSFLHKADIVQTDTLVAMERTVCFGTCPAYSLTIESDGKVTFNGKQFVQHTGVVTGEMNQKNLDQLIKRIDESNFMEFPTNPECESRYTDMPSVYLTIQLDGKRNSLTHYHGCKGFEFEEDLFALEEAIDSLAGTDKWIDEE